MTAHIYSYTDAELAKELREIAERGHTVRGKPDAAWFMRQAADALERARGPNVGDTIPMPKAWIEAAKCDNCGGQGWRAIQVEAGVFEQEQCQWCFERWLALGQPSPSATSGD
jgi:hypothetical protein